MKHKYANKKQNIPTEAAPVEEQEPLATPVAEDVPVVREEADSGKKTVLMPNRRLRMILVIALVVLVFAAVLAVSIYFIIDRSRSVTITFECSIVSENIEDITVKKGETPEMPTLERAGYQFLGWYDEEDRLIDADFFRTYDFSADLIVHDKWSIGDSAVITYVTRGGTPLSPVVVPKGYALDQVGQTERSGFQFMGWCYDEQCLHVYNPDFDVITGDTTFYAKWLLLSVGETDTINVYFVTSGGTPVEQRVVPIGTMFEYAETYQIAHEFDGWYSDDNYLYPVDPDVVLTQTCTLFAKWRPTDATCTISFVADAPVDIASATLPIYTQVEVGDVPKPEIVNYNLEGLYTDSEHANVAEFPILLKQDTTVYLHYVSTVQVYVDVYFYYADDQYVTRSILKDTLVTYLDPPERTGYTFDNWYVDREYSAVFDFEHTLASQGLCVYAKWLSETDYSDAYFVYTLSDDGTYLIADHEVDVSRRNVVVADTCRGLPVKVIRANLFFSALKDSVTIGSNVVEIGESAFDNCTITSIELPGSVRVVANNAFYHAYYLQSVTAAGYISIGNEAFKNCDRLETVSMPYAISIGKQAFENCTKLTTVTLTYMSGHGEMDYGVIDEAAFTGCNRLTTVNLSQARLYEIPINAFRGTKLASIDLYSTVKVLRNGCFAGTNLTSFNTKSVTTIEHNVFNKCSFLQSVTIMEDLVDMQVSCFDGCDSLAGFTVMPGNTVYSSPYDDGCLYNKDGNKLLLYAGLGDSYQLPAAVTSLNDEAFLLAGNLSSIAVSALTHYRAIDGNLYTTDGKTLIFYAPAKSAAVFVMPEGVEALRALAFYSSADLSEVYLCDSLRNFSIWSFSNLPGLTSIVCVDAEQMALISVSTTAEDLAKVVYQCRNVTVSVAE